MYLDSYLHSMMDPDPGGKKLKKGKEIGYYLQFITIYTVNLDQLYGL